MYDSLQVALFNSLKEGTKSEKVLTLSFSPFGNLVVRRRALNQGNRYTLKEHTVCHP